MERNQVVLIFEDGADHAPWSHVKGIRITIGDYDRDFLLSDIREAYFECELHPVDTAPPRVTPLAETREQAIKQACDTLKANGMYNIFSIEYRNMLDQIEQQKKAIDALKFTIEVMSKTIEDQQATIKEYREKPEVRTVSTKEIPIWYLKITDPRDDDMKEASEVIKHFRPNFEIVKTNLQDCPDGCNKHCDNAGSKIHLCESCNKSESQWELKDTTGSGEIYRLCSNCLGELVDLCLSPAHFTNLIRNGHKANEFMLHSDFYDEDGNALQPRGG